MTFHTRSVAELGRLFTDLTVKLSQEDLSATLEMLRIYFNSEAVLILVEWKQSKEHTYRELNAEPGSNLNLEKITQKSGAISAPQRYIALKATFLDTEDLARYTIHFFKPDTQAKFDEDEHTLADLIVAQIGRYLKKNYHHSNAERERALYTNLVDRFEVGIILLDQQGQVFSVSERANQFLEKRDGLSIINNRLSASNIAENKKLQALISDAISNENSESSGKGMSLSKQSSEKTLSVLVRRIPNIEHAWQGAVSIYIRDSDTAPDVGTEMMRQIFGLTPTEASVARLLATGLSLEDTAIALDITRNTARAHLRSIFSKSGIKRQTELVRLVLNSAVVL